MVTKDESSCKKKFKLYPAENENVTSSFPEESMP
jgi:hypothetical protein